MSLGNTRASQRPGDLKLIAGTESGERGDHQQPGFADEATVGAVCGGQLRVVLESGTSMPAKLSVVGSYEPSVGDRVLVLVNQDRAWVVGVLRALRPVDARNSMFPPAEPASGLQELTGSAADAGVHAQQLNTSEVRAQDGVRAHLQEEGQRLVVVDGDGKLLFTHDASTGRSVAHAPGSLSLRAEAGELELSASENVRIVSERAVEISAKEKISLETSADNALSLDRKGLSLKSERLDAIVKKAKLTMADTLFAADRVQTAVHRSKHVAGLIDLRAQRIVQRAKDVFQEVDGVSQTRAGRMRIIAKGAYQVLSERATIKAKEDLALLGEKIHLA